MEAHDFYAVLQLLGKPVTYYPNICHALDKDVRCALFLSNFYYWEGKQHDEEGWIYKKQIDISRETGLNRSSQEIARKKLRELGILEEMVKGKPPILHYRFNWQKMNEVLSKHFSGEKIQKETTIDPLLFRLKIVFEEKYLKESGFTYEWPPGKESGKEWKNIQRLSAAFKQRLIDRKKNNLPPGTEIIVTDDEIVNSFTHFLVMLPKHHIEKNLTPALLYSNFSKIIMELVSNAKRDSQTQGTANQYV